MTVQPEAPALGLFRNFSLLIIAIPSTITDNTKSNYNDMFCLIILIGIRIIRERKKVSKLTETSLSSAKFREYEYTSLEQSERK